MSSTQRAVSGSRLARAAVLVTGLAMLGWGLVSGAADDHAQAQAKLDAAARSIAIEKTSALDEYFDRARSLLLLAAQNPSFRQYYERRNGGANADVARPAMTDVDAALEYFHRLYPDSIGEVCFIDRAGSENARIVHGISAAPSELSADETSNAFFGPTLAVPVNEVLQATPYISPDTNDWVISNSTLLPAENGQVLAMLHFEVTLESFRQLLGLTSSGHQISIVDSRTGVIVADDEGEMAPGPVFGSKIGVAIPPGDGLSEIGGRRFAHSQVMRTPYNENEWTVIVEVPSASYTLGGVWNARTVELVAAALALLALGWFAARGNRLRAAAYTDGLTGLPNRRQFLQDADRLLAQAGRAGTGLAVLLLDLDRFKEVNDCLGHLAGDELLREVGPRVQQVLLPEDSIARLGGDEFAVLLGSVTDSQEAGAMAARIADVLRQPFQSGSYAFEIEVSIGIALSGVHGDTTEVLLQRADIAMYAAKREHLGIVTFEAELDVHRPEQLTLLGDLREAIRTNDLTVCFQPKVALATGSVVGVEALVRWQHPERGLVPPEEFVVLAETSSLIGPLTNFVLDEALAQCGRFAQLGWELTVAVNVSARSVRDPRFTELVLDALERSGVPPRLLVLEITESAIMTDPTTARRMLHDLDAAGVQISIDDFGTGYSSLAYLQDLPIHELKIDRSFVTDLCRNPAAAMIVRSVIDLARNLGLRVVAEGIEDDVTARRLAAFGCDVGQGFLWSRPVTTDQLFAWLAGVMPPSIERGVRAVTAESAGRRPDGDVVVAGLSLSSNAIA